MLFYLALILFISSLVVGIILMMAVKDFKTNRFYLSAAVHGFILLFFLLSLLMTRSSGSNTNFLFTLFLCSGIILSGLSWRSNVKLPWKIYFSLFALTVPMFIFSPSMLMNFLLTGKYSGSTGKIFHLKDNYFLEEQSMFMKTRGESRYKIIRKNGLYHHVVARDLTVKSIPDSVRVLDWNLEESVQIRVYTSKVNLVEAVIDSTDFTVPMKVRKQNDIEWHL